MRRRRDNKPDTRLDWRDPQMPVLRAMDTGMEALSPESETEFAQDVMARSLDKRWNEDPSYNWARPGARKRRL